MFFEYETPKVITVKNVPMGILRAVIVMSTMVGFIYTFCYTAGGFVWCDRPFYQVKQPQEKWKCDFIDDAPPLSFQLQVAEVIF